jgi:hypothetical protein
MSYKLQDDWKDFYKRYPDLFLEDFLGIKLYWYQKFYVRYLMRK